MTASDLRPAARDGNIIPGRPANDPPGFCGTTIEALAG
jgi:hypothetical protein